MMEKEQALNELQRQREKLWAEREGIVDGMRAELDAERERMGTAWAQSKGEWDGLKAAHHELHVALGQRQLDAERLHEGVVAQSTTLLTELQAERRLLSGERELCRADRAELSKALIEHRADVARHREEMFAAMQVNAPPPRADALPPLSEWVRGAGARRAKRRRRARVARRARAPRVAAARGGHRHAKLPVRAIRRRQGARAARQARHQPRETRRTRGARRRRALSLHPRRYVATLHEKQHASERESRLRAAADAAAGHMALARRDADGSAPPSGAGTPPAAADGVDATAVSQRISEQQRRLHENAAALLASAPSPASAPRSDAARSGFAADALAVFPFRTGAAPSATEPEKDRIDAAVSSLATQLEEEMRK